MVWPILISVDVTPRISAASEVTGQASTKANAASALTTPNLVTKGIDAPPFYLGTLKWRPRQARFGRALAGTCHGGAVDANSNDAGAGYSLIRSPRRRGRAARPEWRCRASWRS